MTNDPRTIVVPDHIGDLDYNDLLDCYVFVPNPSFDVGRLDIMFGRSYGY